MTRDWHLTPLALIALTGSLARPAEAAPPAVIPYHVRPVIMLGDTIGGSSIRADGSFSIGSLNDSGQLLVDLSSSRGDVLFQYSGGSFVPVAMPGGPAAHGTWTQSLSILAPPRMNQHGNVVFSAWDFVTNQWLGVFRWDSTTHQTMPVAVPGMAAGSGLTLIDTKSFGLVPAINNHDDVAFAAQFQDAAGDDHPPGVFFAGRDGTLKAVALPGLTTVDGNDVGFAFFPTLNDNGQVALLAGLGGGGSPPLLWDQGKITTVVSPGQMAPDGATIDDVDGAWVNNKNGNVLVEAVLDDPNQSPLALYLWANGHLIPVAVSGKSMPGGGTFKTLTLKPGFVSVSDANDQGQHAFLATIVEGGQSTVGAYRMEADGSLSLIVKKGSLTDLGEVSQIGIGAEGSLGISLNSQGQVALPLRISGMASMVALLTPAGP